MPRLSPQARARRNARLVADVRRGMTVAAAAAKHGEKVRLPADAVRLPTQRT